MKDSELIKKTLLETMIYFHQFCEENNLKYFLVGGTLLGAVRHKGFIPWDDDLDVIMPYEDYKKLLNLHKNIKSPFSLLDFNIDEKYIYPFAKLSNERVIVKENLYKPLTCGLWLDIFPLGYTFESMVLQKLHFKLIRFFKILYILKHGSFKLEKRNKFYLTILKAGYSIFSIIPSKLFLNIFSFLEYKFAPIFNPKENLANFHGAWGVKEVAPKELFDKRKLYDFEGHKFWSVEDADFWLSKVYGDYMTPPPIEKRVSPHIGEILEVKDER